MHDRHILFEFGQLFEEVGIDDIYLLDRMLGEKQYVATLPFQEANIRTSVIKIETAILQPVFYFRDELTGFLTFARVFPSVIYRFPGTGGPPSYEHLEKIARPTAATFHNCRGIRTHAEIEHISGSFG